MKYFILIGVLFILSFDAYSLYSEKHMTNSRLIHEVYNKKSSDVLMILELAERYFHGREGMSEDPKKSVELYKKAAERGNFKAISQIGHFYEQGWPIDRDLSRAVQFYEQALNIAIRQIAKNELSDYHDLNFILGRLFILHERGLYSSKLFLKKGLFLYQKIYEGEPKIPSHNKAELYGQARKGDITALLKLADHESIANYPEKRFLLMTAAELGSVQAMVELAETYRYEYDNAPRTKHTIQRAVSLYEQASIEGSITAAEELAEIYRDGVRDTANTDTMLIDKNFSKARAFYTKAAELGSFSAMDVLAKMYAEGGLGIKPNLEKALQYHVMILETKVTHQETVGTKFIAHLKEKSITYLQEFANKGSAEASYQLGRFYRDGLRVNKKYQILPVNLALAVLFFERASEKEHEKAKEALRSMIPEDMRQVNSFACPAVFAN